MSTSVSMSTSLPPIGTFDGTLPPFDPSKMPPPPGQPSSGSTVDFSASVSVNPTSSDQDDALLEMMKLFAQMYGADGDDEDADDTQACHGSTGSAPDGSTAMSPMATFQITATVYG